MTFFEEVDVDEMLVTLAESLTLTLATIFTVFAPAGKKSWDFGPFLLNKGKLAHDLLVLYYTQFNYERP